MGYFTKTERIKLGKTNKKKLLVAICLGVSFLLIAVVLMIVDPNLILFKYCTRAANGSYLHELMKTKVEGVHLSAYLFNVTNAEQFQLGKDQKLKLQEIGPFTYQEMRYHENLEFDRQAGVIRYSPNIGINFLPEESVGRPEDINITMPNIAMLSIASKISTFSYFTQIGYNMLTNTLKSKSIVSMSAQDYLWGYDEPLIRLSSTLLPSWINFKTLGVLDRLYDSKTRYQFEVSANNNDKFAIKSVNGSRGLKAWSYDDPSKRTKCNSFVDVYEGIAYPPELTPEKPIRIYRNVLCRFLELDFQKKMTTEYGTDGLVYKISNKTYTQNPDTECMCSEDACFDGVSDLSPCFYSLPVVLSNAHFLHADPKLYERIEGLNPNEKDHGSAVIIEPKTGMPLTTVLSVQLNILVKDVNFNHETTKFSNMLIPVAYFKIVQPKLKVDQVDVLKWLYVTGPYICLGVQIFLIITSLALLTYSTRILYTNWKYTKEGITFHVAVSNKSSVERPLIR